MNLGSDNVPTTVTRVHDCLVANIQTDLTDDVYRGLCETLLQRITESSIRGVVLDFSGLRVMDTAEFESVRKLVRMVELLGPRCVCSGLSAGIVAYLVSVNAETGGIKSTLGLDEALAWIESQTKNSP